MYKNRSGSIQGQLYETKLLSLILFRAQHDHNIKEFYLGSNLENAGHFDDICFKVKITGFDRPLAVFIQVKHTDNDRIAIFNRSNIVKYFKSYLKIKQSFNPHSKDILFNEHFDNTECLCILYTNAKGDFKKDIIKSPFANHLNELIGTSMIDGSQLCYTEENVKLLEKEFLKDEMKILAQRFAKFIFTERNMNMMIDEYIFRYHVILAKNVVNVSRVNNEYNVCTFRHDFCSTSDENLAQFNEELCQNAFELLQLKKKHHSIQESHINEFLSDPSEQTLINVIGSIVTYKNNKLKFITDMPDVLKKQLSLINLPHSTIIQVIKTVTINKLKLLTFKVPSTFGNTDLILGGNTCKFEKRINVLADYILNLIKESKPLANATRIISIDETIPHGFLRRLAGTVGNLLVNDEEDGLLKFASDCSSLESNAKYLLVKIRHEIDDLQKYRFEVKIKKFPKLQISDHNEQHQVKIFFNNLMLWTDQASHEGVENILKEEIENHESYSKTNYFRIKSDAIFMKYHDNIQKWWMSPNPHYLTKDVNMYQVTVNDIIGNPLIRITSMMYMKKIKTAEYSFNENTLALFAGNFSKTVKTIFVTNITILTVIKVIQSLSKLNFYEPAVLDIKYILEMLTDEFYALISELKNRDVRDIFIIVCDDLNNILPSNMRLQKLVNAISGKETVIITNNTNVSMMTQYFPQIGEVVFDEKHNMEDLEPSSQSKILNNAKVSFQGQNVPLAHLVDGLPMKFIEGSVLRNVILNENITIGGSLTNSNNDKMQHLFVDRKVLCNQGSLELRTLYDIKDDIVILVGKPGIGKSTLLTHLALKTKKIDSKLWIVQINFIDCVIYFNKWQKHEMVISRLEMLKFMCQVILQIVRPGYKATISLQIESNGEVNLLECGNNEWVTFELRLFLHFYMKRNVIFLFDGFDEISPHYTETVMDFLNAIKDDCCKNKMWITSRLYKDENRLLQSNFGIPYELKGFEENELYVYLDKFWKTNLILSNFDKEHIERVKEYLDNFLTDNALSTSLLNHPLGCVHDSLILYLITNFPDLNGRDRWRVLYDTITSSLKQMPVSEEGSSSNKLHKFEVETPLVAYLSANYFADYIKHLDDSSSETVCHINLTSIYEQFVRTKLLKHFIHDKKVDIYNPNIKRIYDAEFQKLMKLYNS